MTIPGPPGEEERPLAGPDTSMGLPESGTQHATSTDFEVPVNRPAGPLSDPLTSPPPARPAPPVYDEPADLVQSVEPAVTAPAAGDAAGGLLEKVKAFADRRPEAFLGAALAAGWLVGKLLSSSGDDEDE